MRVLTLLSVQPAGLIRSTDQIFESHGEMIYEKKACIMLDDMIQVRTKTLLELISLLFTNQQLMTKCVFLVKSFVLRLSSKMFKSRRVHCALLLSM